MDQDVIRYQEIRQAFIVAGLIDPLDVLSDRDLKFGEALLVPALAEKLISTQFTGKDATAPPAPPMLEWSGDIPTVSTLRDQFAMAALQYPCLEDITPCGEQGNVSCIANAAYELADAMLEARKK